jgi:arylsulfatase
VGAPRVSVVVATTADAESLPGLLERLRPQVDAACGELIVAVNRGRAGARREVVEACERIADRVLYEARPGKSRALNEAVRQARGELCAFIDDDAEPAADWLAQLVAPFAQDPSVAGVGGRVLPVLPHDGVPGWYRRLCRRRATHFLGPRHDLGDQAREYAAGSFATLPLGANCAWRRELLAELGYADDLGPNRESGTRGGEDTLLARQVVDGGRRVVYAPGAIVHHPVARERLQARYVLEGFYWQGVQRVRIHRHLGLEFEQGLLAKARRRVRMGAPWAALERWLPRALAVPLLKSRQYYLGLLDELKGRSGSGRCATFVPLLVAALFLAACGAEAPVSAAAAGKPNVLVFLIDTLRADHLGCYGYARPTSPALDSFAATATRFENVYAQAPRTVASHASLFTSTYPAVHGAWNEAHAAEGEDAPMPNLSDKAVTLAEVLAESGYDTAGICDGGWLIKRRGLAQGFAHFESRFRGVEDRVGEALKWLEKRSKEEQPFFLFLHTYEVHTPWLPEPELLAPFVGDYHGKLLGVLEEARAFHASGQVKNPIVETHRKFFEPLLGELGAEDVEFVKALYDAEIRKVDREFARLLAALDALGLAEDTLVIVTSDHGEEFGEHGHWEHVQVYDECLRVPLIVRLPGQRAGEVRKGAVELVDVMPTLLAELDLRIPEAAQGRAIDLRAPETAGPERELWAETNEPRAQIAWRRGSSKVVLHADEDARGEVFDLASDPRETNDLASGEGGTAAAAQARLSLEAWRSTSFEHAKRFGLDPSQLSLSELDEQAIRELEALGYVGGAAK